MPYIFQFHVCNAPNFTQQAYRYGIALSCIGVLLNWLSVAQAYIGPLRFLGVGLLVFGSFLIIVAMFRWMYLVPHVPAQMAAARDMALHGDLHIVSVPLSLRGPAAMYPHLHAPHPSFDPSNKPPDYQQVMEKPPSYEEAVAIFMASRPSEGSLPPYTPRFDQPLHDGNESIMQDSVSCGQGISGSVSLPAFTGDKIAPESSSSPPVAHQSISIDQLELASHALPTLCPPSMCAPLHAPGPLHPVDETKDDASETRSSTPVIINLSECHDNQRRLSLGSGEATPQEQARGRRCDVAGFVLTPAFSTAAVNMTPRVHDTAKSVIVFKTANSSSFPNISSSGL